MSQRVSEPARQLYEAILREGFISPEHTWEQFAILNILAVTNGEAYAWLRELEGEDLVRKIESAHFAHGPSFYAVPPPGFVPAKEPGHLTAMNSVKSFESGNAAIDTDFSRVSSKDPKNAPFHEIPLPGTEFHINVSPVFNNINQRALSEAKQSATWFGSWGTWAGVVVAAVAIYLTLHLAGKI